MPAHAVTDDSLPPPPGRRPTPHFARRRAIAAAGATAVLLVALVGVVTFARFAFGVVTDDGPFGSRAAPADPPPTEPAPTTSTTTAVIADGPRHNDLSLPPVFPTRTPPVREVSGADPLTIWTIGDSTAQALGQLLSVNFANDTRVATRTVSMNSTGLTRQDFYDWPAALPALLAEGAPDAVIVSLGDNDAQPLQANGSSTFVGVGSPEWIAEYARRLAGFVDQLSAAGSRVYLVGQPVMRDPVFNDRIAVVDRAYRSLASANPGVTYIDSRALLGDDAGGYTDTLPDAGESVEVRNTDGVHLSLEGARWMARVVGRMVAADYGVTAP